ncbi:E3 ubiquitin-protein ligase XIAP-like isoform X2 [Mizuhopecten yessoensis]|uniref:Inhibitor of apoptosis protein n=1 Tax=Mizuhopecten yessoensis TaxID=6573 RepID=A0A210PRW0_MIZYE|nr:E3 ubiquitin-protein ligase XIAP-like isoform X2 [Mizuhopecten yessoensis]OWF39186.1 Inhibitor of apoptosis protein [Mizuhopecten yessoensis]
MELTTILNILQWSIRCNGRKDKSRNILLSLRTRVFRQILCMLLLCEYMPFTLYNQRRHKQVCTLIGNTVKGRYKLTSHHVSIWSYILESLLSAAHLRVKENLLHISKSGQSLDTSHQRAKKLLLPNIANGKIVCKHIEKGKMKHLRSSKETIEKFVRRRKTYKHICLSKESDLLNGGQMITVLCCFSSSINTNISEICTNQTHKVVSVKLESRSTTLQSMETQIRTTVMYSDTDNCTKGRPMFEESRKYLQSNRIFHRYKTEYQCMDIPLQRQALSNTITEIKQEVMLSSKAENKRLYQYGIDMHQNLQVYPVQQFSLEQAFISCGEGGQTITNPEVFFSNNLTRLSSYRNFPSKLAPSAIKLSNAGFYATGNVDETACFHCGCRYSRWNPSEDPVQTHEEISPECEFIQEIFANEGRNGKVGSHATNGILCSEETETLSRLDQTGDSLIVYGNEHLVRNTSIVNKDSLNERSTSPCSNIKMANPTEDFQMKKHHFNDGKGSECAFHAETPSMTSISCELQSISLDNAPSTVSLPVPSKPSSTSVSCNSCFEKVPLNDKSVQQKKRRHLATNGETAVHGNWKQTNPDLIHPLFPQYISLPVRMSSFAKWPTHVKQTAKEMSLAGFFYKGYGDAVACYWCGVCIVSWEEEDEPCIEHVKWKPLCPYTIQTKGQDFVDLVLEQQGRLYQGDKSIDDYNVAEQTLSSNNAVEEVKYTKLKEMGFKQREIDIAVCKVSRQKENPAEEDILEQLLNDDTKGETTETIPPTAMSFQRDQEPWNVTSKYNYATSANSSEDIDHLSRVERLMCKICMTQEIMVLTLSAGDEDNQCYSFQSAIIPRGMNNYVMSTGRWDKIQRDVLVIIICTKLLKDETGIRRNNEETLIR